MDVKVEIKNKLEAAYCILIMSTALDGNYTQDKGWIVVKYLRSVGEKGTSDVLEMDRVNEELLSCPQEYRQHVFMACAVFFKKLANESECLDLIIKMYEINDLSRGDEVHKAIQEVAKIFDVDISQLFGTSLIDSLQDNR